MNFLARLKANGRQKVDEPKEDPTSLGNIAVEAEFVTKEDLDEALAAQEAQLKIGQILVERGKITESQLKNLIFEQKVRRGEVTDKKEILKFRRSLFKENLCAIKEGYKEASQDARQFALTMTGKIAK
jgi:hypothetical protein